MISSIVWLYLLYNGFIQEGHAPWEIYIPIALVEVVVYLYSLPKIADFIDKVMNNKVEGE